MWLSYRSNEIHRQPATASHHSLEHHTHSAHTHTHTQSVSCNVSSVPSPPRSPPRPKPVGQPVHPHASPLGDSSIINIPVRLLPSREHKRDGQNCGATLPFSRCMAFSTKHEVVIALVGHVRVRPLSPQSDGPHDAVLFRPSIERAWGRHEGGADSRSSN